MTSDLPMADKIIAHVCQREMLSRGLMIEHTRHPVYVKWRKVAMLAIRQATDLSLNEIGAIFSGRHHTTIMHAISTADRRMAQTILTEIMNGVE